MSPLRTRNPALRRVLTGIVLLTALWTLWPAEHGGRLGMIVVNGNSMRPTYVPGEVLLSWPGELRVGEAVLLEVPDRQPSAGRLVIHRIHGRDAGGWITKGDNSSAVDGWRLDDADVLGRVVLRLPGVGELLAAMRDPLVLGLIAGALCVSAVWPSRLGGRNGRWEGVSLTPSCPCEDTCTSPGPGLRADDGILLDALRSTGTTGDAAGEASAAERGSGSPATAHPDRTLRQREDVLLRTLRRQDRADRVAVLARTLRTRLRRIGRRSRVGVRLVGWTHSDPPTGPTRWLG